MRGTEEVQETPTKITVEKASNKSSELSVSGPKESDELYQYLNGRGFCRLHDLIILLFFMGIIAFVWVKVYRQPIPPLVMRMLGMDDPMFEKRE